MNSIELFDHTGFYAKNDRFVLAPQFQRVFLKPAENINVIGM